MKNRVFFLGALLCAILFGLASCEGDEGPIGPAGPGGPQGPDGIAGTANCIQCHGSSQKITAKLFQWEHSVHATGGHFDRNDKACAICHTSQGFLERIATGATQTAAPIQDPLPQNCYTCHKIHTTYTEADWALTQTEPVTLWVTGETVDLGKANLCISCHQSRISTPSIPVPNSGEILNIQTTRYGPHYGPQGAMLPGFGGFEVSGPEPYENSAHTMLLANNFKHACIVCHMGPIQDGIASGGHTFRVISEEGEINTASCLECHPVSADVLAIVDDRQAQIEVLLAELEELLVARGKYNPTTEQNTKGDYTTEEAGALYNYKFVKEDRSRGVHNFKYAHALLVNSIASLQ